MAPDAKEPWDIRFHRGVLHLAAPSTFDPKRELKLDGWKWDPSFDRWSCHAAGYASFHAAAQARPDQFADHVRHWQEITLGIDDAIALRPYQRDAVARWEWFNRRGLVVLPTGMGKTEIALEIMRRTKVPTLVVAPIKDLMHQWHRRIAKSTGYAAGVIGDRERDVRDVSVTTYASACLHMEELGHRFALIIFDECHHLTGEMRTDAARMSVAPYRLGLTATPRVATRASEDCRTLIGPVCYRCDREDARIQRRASSVAASYNFFRRERAEGGAPSPKNDGSRERALRPSSNRGKYATKWPSSQYVKVKV